MLIKKNNYPLKIETIVSNEKKIKLKIKTIVFLEKELSGSKRQKYSPELRLCLIVIVKKTKLI